MTLILNGTTGVSGVDGSAATPAFQGNDANTGISFGTDIVTINTGGVARVTTDASGNVGLGATPSAWNALFKVFEIGTAASFVGTFNSADIYMAFNGYFDTSWKYKTSNFATRYTQGNGEHTWFNAPSGTAGNAISFTQAMTLDASGNLLVGTTAASYGASGRSTIEVNGSTDSLISLKIGGGTTNAVYQYNTTASFETNVTGSRYCNWTVNGSERMRIEASGNFLVGTTSSGGEGGVSFRVSGSATPNVLWNRASSTGTSYPLEFQNGGNIVGFVSYSNAITTFTSVSDYRLKENVAPMTGALDKIAALKPVTYTWKTDGSAGQGFIAHELQAVVPDCVTGTKDAVDKDGNPQYQGVDTSFLVATLVAAIQELKAEVDALKGAQNV